MTDKQKCQSRAGTPLPDHREATDTLLQMLENWDNIFKCTICLIKLDDPHLCPRCSKLYCYGCIAEWLSDDRDRDDDDYVVVDDDAGGSSSSAGNRRRGRRHRNCPNCKVDLQLDSLVKVRWFEEVEKLQQHRNQKGSSSGGGGGDPKVATSRLAIDGPGQNNGGGSSAMISRKDFCPKHLKVINFYCCTCKLCVCEQCAVSDRYHLNHTFKSLDVIYESNLEIAEEEFEKVRHYSQKIAALIAKVDRNMELVRKVKDEKLREIRDIAEAAIKGLERQVGEKMLKLQEHKFALSTEMQEVESALQRMESEVTGSSKSQFIAKKSRLFKECTQIRMNPIKDFKQIRVPVSLKIEIPIIYETGIFVIENFSSFDDNKMAYSNEFADNFGHLWRIMVWCVISDDQLGIYLELVDGFPCWMECRFQLIHPDSKRGIHKKIEQYFDRSSQKDWGFRDFVALKTILDDNYLKEDDSLELLYHIRPCGSGDHPES
ncbi:E3 ubiquitin-protein ligase TRIM37-like [Uranotaenia lowii]|uniref:E3 ubiquitin-protein ligase TRIM37-like n=1 Tax=Uranotaenia lowii TaxID=190385 RepID=UPI0024792087|nr:E3 ubiquitin-protein ligase TRIM37-like [Uranotaenia lowii]XP_055610204.1 E3 ubiquitin-protein ligase TRIM37-like [Uranotaenia lowii]